MTVQPANQSFDGANIEVVDIETRERKVVHRGGSYGRYLASGHLVFVREATLYAAPFDPASDHVVKGTGSIESRLSRHAASLPPRG